jgi:hypothetical protein
MYAHAHFAYFCKAPERRSSIFAAKLIQKGTDISHALDRRLILTKAGGPSGKRVKSASEIPVLGGFHRVKSDP